MAGIPETAGAPYWQQWAAWVESAESHAVAAKQREAAARARAARTRR